MTEHREPEDRSTTGTAGRAAPDSERISGAGTAGPVAAPRRPGGAPRNRVDALRSRVDGLRSRVDAVRPPVDAVRRRVDAVQSRLPRWARPPREEDFTSPTHAPAVSARLGLWLGIAFTACFVTGVFSHLGQHPAGWFSWPTRPVNLYRVTQGIHVLSGIAAIPLLLAKLWSVFPKLFARPPRARLASLAAHATERVSILVLLAAAFFELITGLFNVAQSYPWGFFFPAVHYAVAWVVAGSMVVHVAVKLPVIRIALGSGVDAEPSPSPSPSSGPAPLAPLAPPAERPEPAVARVRGGDRRAFLATALGAAGVAVLATAGVTVPWLRRVSPLAWRSDGGPQGVPVNRTAVAAGITVAGDWRLQVSWLGGDRWFTLAELAELPQRTAVLPIACVEGWSASAEWTGVPVRELLAAAGAPADRPVRVSSLEGGGLFAGSTLPPAHVADGLTLLALRMNGDVLHLDHGYPCRIIAPARPGVLQTKWVSRLEVLR